MKPANAKIQVFNSLPKTLRASLWNANFYAPINRVAAKRQVMPGDAVTQGKEIFPVFGTTEIRVTTVFPENDLYHLFIHIRAQIKLRLFK